MATNDQVKALVKSHADGDDPQFYAVAMQVAAKAARAGQSKFAQELRDLVNDLRERSGQRARIAAVDVMAELTPLTEPQEYVNLAPTTGPVPLVVPVSELPPTRPSRPLVAAEEPVAEATASKQVVGVTTEADVAPRRDHAAGRLVGQQRLR